MLKIPVATRMMISATTSMRSFMAFLSTAPTSRPMMNGRTTGIIQAISGGIDMFFPESWLFSVRKQLRKLLYKILAAVCVRLSTDARSQRIRPEERVLSWEVTEKFKITESMSKAGNHWK